MKKLYVMLAVMVSMLSLVGCGNTADGVEKDVDKAIDTVKDATN